MHSQLSTWISSDDVESEADFEISDSYESVLGLFLDEAINEETTTIILYHPYECLLQDGTVRWSQESSIELFKEACCRKGIVFVDMTDDFDCLYCQKNQLPHGFITGRVGKGHINKYGHKAIAERLYAVISELEVR